MASAPKPRSLTLTPTLNGHGRITELNMDTDPGKGQEDLAQICLFQSKDKRGRDAEQPK